ncbi:MAG: hypothetical protein QM811_21735 [Pirellulales bacterium]
MLGREMFGRAAGMLGRDMPPPPKLCPPPPIPPPPTRPIEGPRAKVGVIDETVNAAMVSVANQGRRAEKHNMMLLRKDLE